MILGETQRVLLAPRHVANLDTFEGIVPVQQTLTNGHVTLAENWERRPGMVAWKDLGVPHPVELLIPLDEGYAVTRDGRIFELAGGRQVNTFLLCGVERPTYANYDGNVIICDGVHPVIINTGGIGRPMEGNPPRAKFCAVLDSIIILAGDRSTSVRWGDVGSLKSFPFENRNETSRDGEAITMLKVLERRLWFFKERSIEVWVHTDSAQQFVAQARIDKGTPAGHSVILLGGRFYFLGHDLEFYRMNGLHPESISATIRATMNTLRHPEDCYGIHFQREYVVRWFFPRDERVLTWDYVRNQWSEDSLWYQGEDRLIPVASYMELGGRAYVGSSQPTGRIHTWEAEAPDDLMQTLRSDVEAHPIRQAREFRIALSRTGQRTQVRRLRLRAKRGDQTDTDARRQATESQGNLGLQRRMLARWRFDEGEWCPRVEVNMSQVGERYPYWDIYQLGTGHEMLLELVAAGRALDFLVTDGLLTTEPAGM